jgi:hypothetical protein
LFLGNHADNNRDKVEKGRQVNLRGSEHARAKFTEEEVLAIVEDLKSRSKIAIARDYDVSATAISDIARGVVWGHLTGISHKEPSRPHFSKISGDDAIEIVRTYTPATSRQLAEQFKISDRTVKAIASGLRWAKITGATKGIPRF